MARIIACEQVENGCVIVDKHHVVSVIGVRPFGLQEVSSHREDIRAQYRAFLREVRYPATVIVRQVNTGEPFTRLLAEIEQPEVRTTLDTFRSWLKLLMQSYARPLCLCYVVVHVSTTANVLRGRDARAHAFNILQLRAKRCLRQLHSITLGQKRLRAWILSDEHLRNLIASYNHESVFLPDGRYGRYYSAAELLQLWGDEYETVIV